MSLDEALTRSVVFIVSADGEVAGTGFLVAVSEFGESFHYIVTAAHVVSVEVSAGEPWVEQAGTSVRIRQRPSGVHDRPVHEWIFHPTADIAVTRYVPQKADDLQAYALSLPTKHGISAFYPPQLGQVVYFVGQLRYVPSMLERNIPMVRSGTVGAMYQEAIPVDWFSTGLATSQTETSGHLIDCRSYFGFSGSPVFLESPIEHVDGMTSHGALYAPVLFGIISGHFPQPEHVRLEWETETEEYGRVNISAGVGIVTPIERLEELLRSEEITGMREDEAEAKRRKRKGRLPPAVGDKKPETREGFDRMTDLTRQLFQVPKDEADEVHRNHEG